MRKVLSVFLSFMLAASVGYISYAQEAAPPQDVQAEPAKQAEPVKKEAAAGCVCLEPATSAINKAYASVEEDEWTIAIKTCKDSITAIKELTKTCKCPEVAVYQSIAEAFLKYSEGGNHLDTVDEPDCPFALKLYSEAIKILSDALPKIKDEQIGAKAKDIKEYAEEEQEFVKDECLNTEEKPAEKTGG